jgi:signal transduction protein with GAF and PtsI domain
MRELGRGTKVFHAAPVRGRLVAMETPEDVLAFMDDGADGVVALVRDAGATFLAPIHHELRAVLCTGGTPRSHIGIVSRELQVPCVMSCTFADDATPLGTDVEVDCSGAEGVIRG